MHDQRGLTRRGMLAGAAGGLALTFGARSAGWTQAAKKIEQLDPALDKIIDKAEPIKELATGYGGDLGPAEGPLWWKEGGYLLFTDIHTSRRMKYTPGSGVTVDLRADQPRQWAHPRPAGPAHLLRARHPPRHPARARRQPHRDRQQLLRASGSTGRTMWW